MLDPVSSYDTQVFDYVYLVVQGEFSPYNIIYSALYMWYNVDMYTLARFFLLKLSIIYGLIFFLRAIK